MDDQEKPIALAQDQQRKEELDLADRPSHLAQPPSEPESLAERGPKRGSKQVDAAFLDLVGIPPGEALTEHQLSALAVFREVVAAARASTPYHAKLIAEMKATAERDQFRRCRVLFLVDHAAELFHASDAPMNADQLLFSARGAADALRRHVERYETAGSTHILQEAEVKRTEQQLKHWGPARFYAVSQFASQAPRIDRRFAYLSAEFIYQQLGRLKPGRPEHGSNAATSYRIAAELSAKCGAFNDHDSNKATGAYRSALDEKWPA